MNGDSLKQAELEFASSAKGVVVLIDLLKSIYDANILSTLRIYDIEKVISKFANFWFEEFELNFMNSRC